MTASGSGGGGGDIQGAVMAHLFVRRISKPRMMIVVASSSAFFSLCSALSLLAFLASAHTISGNFVFLFYSSFFFFSKKQVL